VERRQREFEAWCRERWYAKATEILGHDWEWMLTFYRYPKEHWVHIRTTNVVESPFALCDCGWTLPSGSSGAGHGGDLEDADGGPEEVSPTERTRAVVQGLCRDAVRGWGRGDHGGGRRLMRVYTPLDEKSGMESTRIVCAGEECVVKYSGDGLFSAGDIAFVHEGARWGDVVQANKGEVSFIRSASARQVPNESPSMCTRTRPIGSRFIAARCDSASPAWSAS